ncbi:hypothetical protein DFR60_108128 [Hungatella effluvii]|uniref:Uncharacterized protein n=1 Tax=Hungatella effluvii TaxID=1096246 RepID=A0A2V3YG49_9FIRM|nr:hypothetical protein DFR60_108128 [Hungatella effluvii]
MSMIGQFGLCQIKTYENFEEKFIKRIVVRRKGGSVSLLSWRA